MNPEKTKVILVGNSEYPEWGNPNDDPGIPNVKENLKILKEIFLSDAFGIKDDEDHFIELPEKKSEEVLEMVSRTLKKSRGTIETLFFYYAGHGIPHEEKGLFLTSRNTKSDTYEFNSIEARELKGLIEKSGIPEKIVIIDCCHAEGFSKGKMGILQSQFEQAVPAIAGTYSIFSSAWDNSSRYPVDKPKTPTYFTQALIQAIKNGKPGPSEYLTAEEIYDQLCINLNQLRNAEEAEIPRPVPKSDDIASRFIFCRNRKHQPEFSIDVIELEQIKINPSFNAIRIWQKTYGGSPRMKEAITLIKKCRDAEKKIEEALQLSTEDRKDRLTILAENYSDWSNMLELVMSELEKAYNEPRSVKDQSNLSGIESHFEDKESATKVSAGRFENEENLKASSHQEPILNAQSSPTQKKDTSKW